MPELQAGQLLCQLRRMVGPTDEGSDAELLWRFTRRGEEAAFQALMDRHGPMVRGVCVRVLGHTADADDAFQATFLALIRQARAGARPRSVGGWLHSVSRRLAYKILLRDARRRARERQAPVPADRPADELTMGELRQVLDEELARLPEKYRSPLVLCCLEGMARDEAAEHLGWSAGSVKGRLERGREILRARLARRGWMFPVALLTLTLAQGSASAAVPAALQAATARAALAVAARQGVGPLVSAQAAWLLRCWSHVILAARLRGLALVLAAGIGLAGLTGLPGRGGDESPGRQGVATAAAAPEAALPPAADASEPPPAAEQPPGPEPAPEPEPQPKNRVSVRATAVSFSKGGARSASAKMNRSKRVQKISWPAPGEGRMKAMSGWVSHPTPAPWPHTPVGWPQWGRFPLTPGGKHPFGPCLPSIPPRR